MKILLLSTYFYPDTASTGVIMSKLADMFVTKGHEVTVIASVPHYDRGAIWPEYSDRLLYKKVSGSLTVWRLYTHVVRDRANVLQRILSYGSFHVLSSLVGLTAPKHDVILVPSPPLSNGVIGDLIARLRGTPFVYNVQDVWPDVAVRAGVLKNPRTIRRLRAMEDYVYRRAAGLAVISDGFRDNLLSKGVPVEKVAVIPNFIDIKHITPQPKRNRFSTRLGLLEKFVVLFAGNMGFSQGLETVLDAAKALSDYKDICFLMVGNGASRSSAESYRQELGIDNVKFLPFQPWEDLPDVYGASDVCLIPLRRGFSSESVPCKVFSIMAAGRPAIASVDRGSSTEALILRSGSGICVAPEEPKLLAEAILFYYRDASARLRAGEVARQCVEKEFDPDRIADRYLEILHDATQSRREAIHA